MKINNKKIIVSTLALAMGAALAGSISGSVAWYQYSTRASAQVAGVSAGTARNLQISSDDGAHWSNHVDLGSKKFRPVSYNAGTFYEHPVYKTAQQKAVSTNELTASDSSKVVAYAEYNFVFKCEDNGAQVVKDIYLSYLEIKHTGGDGSKDITPAVRIAIDADNDFLVSNAGGDTLTQGNLDIGGAVGIDKDGWDANDVNGNAVVYTTGAEKYTTVQPSAVVADTTDPYAFANTSGRLMTATKASGNSVAVNVKIWLEGWQKFSDSAVWDQEYINQNFAVNMQFACEADAL